MHLLHIEYIKDFHNLSFRSGALWKCTQGWQNSNKSGVSPPRYLWVRNSYRTFSGRRVNRLMNTFAKLWQIFKEWCRMIINALHTRNLNIWKSGVSPPEYLWVRSSFRIRILFTQFNKEWCRMVTVTMHTKRLIIWMMGVSPPES